MNAAHFRYQHSGSALVEVVIAMGVMAISVPWMIIAFVDSEESNQAAKIENSSVVVVRSVVDELKGIREGGVSKMLQNTEGVPLPPDGEQWSYAYALNFKCLGKIDSQVYHSGLRTIDGNPVGFVVTVNRALISPPSAVVAKDSIRIAVEYPAVQRAAMRRKVEFFTCLK